MNEVLKESIKHFKNSHTIGLYCPRINSVDKVSTILVISEVCKSNKKNFEVYSPSKVPSKYESIFLENNIAINKEFKTKQYIVSIDYGTSNVEKVVCKRDEKSNKLNFVITPGDEAFSFDKVELIPGGSDIELLFLLGVTSNNIESLKSVGSSIKTIVLAKKDPSFGDMKLLVNGNRSYSEYALEFAKSYSSSLSKKIFENSLVGILSKYNLSNNGIILAGNLIKYGADFNNAVNKIFYSKTYSNLDLQIKVMHNVRVDKKARVVWSIVTREDLKNCGLDSKTLDTKGRILFNISKDFDVAFVIYHIGSKISRVVVESNNISKISAMKLMKGRGDSYRVIGEIKGESSKNIEEKIIKGIELGLGVDISKGNRMNFGTSKTEIVQTKVEVLP